MFISTKTTSSYVGKCKGWANWKFWNTLFLYALLRLFVHTCATAKKCTPCDTFFFRNLETNRVLQRSFRYLLNMPIYQPSGKYKLSNLSLLEYCYTIVFINDIFSPSKGYMIYDGNVHKMFSALNLKIICNRSLTYNNTTFSRLF